MIEPKLKLCPVCGKAITPILIYKDTGEEYRFDDIENEELSYFKCFWCCVDSFFDTPYPITNLYTITKT